MSTGSVIKILIASVLLIASCIWAYKNFDFEPVIASVGALLILVEAYISENLNSKKTPAVKQKQKGGKNSTNNQSAGDMNIYNVGRDINNK